MAVDKSLLKDSMGKQLTQSLFLEVKYDTRLAVYTFEDEDKEYKGKTYPSLKKLYLESEDPTEYEFAKEHLLGWAHWQRLNKNNLLRKEFDIWREELEIAIRSAAIRSIIDESAGDKGFQAAKWLADGNWNKRSPGRPSKEDTLRRTAIEERIHSEFDDDFNRMNKDGTMAKGSLQ